MVLRQFQDRRPADMGNYLYITLFASCAAGTRQALRGVIRLAYISSVDEFLKIDGLPSGHGYADVVLFPGKTSSMPL